MQKNEIQAVKGEVTVQTSRNQFLKVYSPDNCIKNAAKIKTLSLAINSSAPTIAAVKHQFGANYQKSYIMAWLVYLNEMTGVKKPMSETQIELCATQLIADFNFLKISDLTLVFKRIITGYYGELYESLSIGKFLSYVREYTEERIQLAATESLRQHNDFQTTEKTTTTDLEDYQRRIKKLFR